MDNPQDAGNRQVDGMPGDLPDFLPEGAFVVQFRTAAQGSALTGRAEHVVSGQAAHFRSPAELLAFLRDVLRPYLPQGGL